MTNSQSSRFRPTSAQTDNNRKKTIDNYWKDEKWSVKRGTREICALSFGITRSKAKAVVFVNLRNLILSWVSRMRVVHFRNSSESWIWRLLASSNSSSSFFHPQLFHDHSITNTEYVTEDRPRLEMSSSVSIHSTQTVLCSLWWSWNDF